MVGNVGAVRSLLRHRADPTLRCGKDHEGPGPFEIALQYQAGNVLLLDQLMGAESPEAPMYPNPNRNPNPNPNPDWRPRRRPPRCTASFTGTARRTPSWKATPHLALTLTLTLMGGQPIVSPPWEATAPAAPALI